MSQADFIAPTAFGTQGGDGSASLVLE